MATSIYSMTPVVQHPGEDLSNEIRRLVAEFEPTCLRTYTPSLLTIAKSAGSYHWTPEGRKLADFTSGVLVANLGHNPIRWWQRVKDYLGWNTATVEGDYLAAVPLTAYNAVTEVEVRASQRLVASLQSQPGGARCEQVMWAASGSEAVQKALWTALARRAGQDIILATRRGFHGKKGLAGAVTGDEHAPERDRRVRFISFPIEECESFERRNQPLDLVPYEQELEAMWREYGQRICCLITEPYLGGGGSYHPQKEYLQLLERFCRERDILLIFDEVQSNFGRTGELYAFTSYGIEPDMVILGKGLGNGIAVSAAVGRADLFKTLRYGEGSDTWSGNPLSSAAVLATLDEFEQTDVMEQARRLAPVLERGLLRIARELPAVAHVRGDALVWGIECAAIHDHSPLYVANALVEACYHGDEQGRAIHLLGPLSGKVIRVSPPLTMSPDEAAWYLDAFYGICARVGQRLGEEGAAR